jgi:hypothetical protein
MIPENQKGFLINHIVDRLTEYLVQDYALDLASALKIIYESKVYNQLQDVELGLYTQSPSYIYELLKKEVPSGNI